MDLGTHYLAFEQRRLEEQSMPQQLERRRVVAERVAELADAAEEVTDAARPRRGIRALLPRRLRLLRPTT
ncbi:hypothetical protein ACFWN7_11555 [Agromyces sp. NPDC058484]|uniref:hypothetical protein n=1 Tax=Agromyces sp. NPDC058484 TaxID=3346524 RepID=UPI00364E5CBF